MTIQSKGILIFGPNGSGKTTLGKQLANELSCLHLDAEELYFDKEDIFYKNPRKKDEVRAMITNAIKSEPLFVLSSVTGDYGNEITNQFQLVVYLSAPLPIRIKRIHERARNKYGVRAHPGGDIYADRVQFVEFVRTRDLSSIDRFADSLPCPILAIDSTEPFDEILAKVLHEVSSLHL